MTRGGMWVRHFALGATSAEEPPPRLFKLTTTLLSALATASGRAPPTTVIRGLDPRTHPEMPRLGGRVSARP